MKNKVTLEEISADRINEAHAQWVEEDDGTEDYPTLGDVLAVRFGLPDIDNVRLDLKIMTAQRDERQKRILTLTRRLL